MKKRGFTLSEIIITLGIIGVVAAITTPMLTGLMPDKNKVQVLKVHKTISDITKDLLKDPSLYRNVKCNSFDANNEVICYGLAYAEMPIVEPYDNVKYTSYGKYPMLLSSRMELADEVQYNKYSQHFLFLNRVHH